jgi:polyisoprenyl-phosphate glycosyltransferase
VAQAYLSVADQDRHHVMLLNWLGYRRATIEYDQEPRRGGKSAYGLSQLIDSAICGLFFSSAKLLRKILYLGVLFAIAGFGLAIALVVRRVMLYTAPGWTSIIVVELILGGVILLSIGTVGLYIGRIFDQVRQRPLFIIDQETQR